MSIWKDQGTSKKDSVPSFAEPAPVREVPREAPRAAEFSPTVSAPPRAVEREGKESLIASDLTIEGKIEGTGHVRIAGKFKGDVNVQGDLTIEGKIEGTGHVRIAGKFKGDVNVQGDLTIETGAKLNGGVRARKVVVGGELEGNIEAADQVELLSSGVLIGDLKAGSLTVASGSRMRGQADFGWDDAKPARQSNGKSAGNDATS